MRKIPVWIVWTRSPHLDKGQNNLPHHHSQPYVIRVLSWANVIKIEARFRYKLQFRALKSERPYVGINFILQLYSLCSLAFFFFYKLYLLLHTGWGWFLFNFVNETRIIIFIVMYKFNNICKNSLRMVLWRPASMLTHIQTKKIEYINTQYSCIEIFA